MTKVKCSRNWAKCDLCGTKIDYEEECFQLQYKKVTLWGQTRYIKAYWHLKHFIFKDHTVKCKEKMECITSQKTPRELGCEKKLCIHYK